MNLLKTKKFHLYFFAMLLFFWASCSDKHTHEKIEKRYSLGPLAKTTIAIKAHSKTRVYFLNEMMPAERQRCENQCIRMYYINKKGDGEAVMSLIGGTLDIEPEGGNINVVVENREKFPMKIKVGWGAM